MSVLGTGRDEATGSLPGTTDTGPPPGGTTDTRPRPTGAPPEAADGRSGPAGAERLGARPLAKAGGENFPVALRVLPRRYRRHLHAIYCFARAVDDVGDEPGVTDRLAALDDIERDVRRACRGERTRVPVVTGMVETIRQHDVPAEPMLKLVEANRIDQRVDRYTTFEQLVRYCDYSANPVGEMVLRVFGQYDARRAALSDRICTALQVIEHLQDVAEDRAAGRVYLPSEDMEKFGVTDRDLTAPRAGAALRTLIRFSSHRAGRMLAAGQPLVGGAHRMRGVGRLAVTGYLAGGRAALRALARAGHDPLPGPPKAGRPALLWELLRTGVTVYAGTPVPGVDR